MKQRLVGDDKRVWRYVCRKVTPMGQHERVRTAPPLQRTRSEPLLDLHNLTVRDAHQAALRHLDQAASMGFDHVTIVTGRSGPISTEFPQWLHSRQDIRKTVCLNDGGAWQVWLKRST